MSILLAAVALCPSASAAPFLPPHGRLFAGVVGGSFDGFAARTRSHPAVLQFFGAWNRPTAYMFDAAAAARARLMIHLSTTEASGELVTPGGIARGRGDRYLLELGRRIAASGHVVYIRLMAEMDGYWNPYCAFDANGRSRGPSHSTASYRQAWRRTVLILRGGPLAALNRRLHALRLPPVVGADADLPRPKVSFLWVPQVAGAPDTRANAPAAYWPGSAYVDWVGTDFYGKFENWTGLERFYAAWRHKPFAFGEWAMWGRDDPAFVHAMFRWFRSHRRVRMAVYNQGERFALAGYPKGAAALGHELRSPLFAPYAPDWSR